MIAAIEIEGLSKTYRQSQVVTDLALSVPVGQVLGLLGTNGAGKTTVLKLLAGLLTPDAGRVRLNGYDLVSEGALARRQVVAVVQGHQAEGRRFVGETTHAGAEQLLREFGLWERRGDPIDDLSHGLQRRVALVNALSTDRPILLLDEPTFGLDGRATCVVKSQVRKLAREQGRTIVVATCHQRLTQELCDRVAVLRDGRLVVDMPVIRKFGLSQPATYQIRVQGSLHERWTKWFDGLTVTTVQGETIISGPVTDQPALHGLLAKIRDLGLPLVAVQRTVLWGEPDLVECYPSDYL